MKTLKIEALWVYPVKSLAGISLTSAELHTEGLAFDQALIHDRHLTLARHLTYDRQWAIVDATGQALTQRQNPLMALIQPQFTPQGLRLTHAELGPISVESDERMILPIRIFNEHCQGNSTKPEVNEWLQQALKTLDAIKLVEFDRHFPRPTDVARFGPHHTLFSDGSPYLIANQASLEALNTALKKEYLTTVDMRRFRPNIVISCLAPFEEHRIKTLNSLDNSLSIALKDHCKRCSIITVDPNTGLRASDQTPFLTLAKLNAMPQQPKAPAFGVNSVLGSGVGGRIRVGETWAFT